MAENITTVLSLDDAGKISGDDYVYLVQGKGSDRDRKAKLSALKTFIASGDLGDITATSVTIAPLGKLAVVDSSHTQKGPIQLWLRPVDIENSQYFRFEVYGAGSGIRSAAPVFIDAPGGLTSTDITATGTVSLPGAKFTPATSSGAVPIAEIAYLYVTQSANFEGTAEFAGDITAKKITASGTIASSSDSGSAALTPSAVIVTDSDGSNFAIVQDTHVKVQNAAGNSLITSESVTTPELVTGKITPKSTPLNVAGNATVTGDLTVNGSLKIGDAGGYYPTIVTEIGEGEYVESKTESTNVMVLAYNDSIQSAVKVYYKCNGSVQSATIAKAAAGMFFKSNDGNTYQVKS